MFAFTSLKKVTFFNEKICVEDYAFRNCASLDTIRIPLKLIIVDFVENLAVKSIEIVGNDEIPRELYETVLKHLSENRIIGWSFDKMKETMKMISNQLEQEQIEKQVSEWKRLNRCQYCGGAFKYPLFGSIKCKNCGMKKDY